MQERVCIIIPCYNEAERIELPNFGFAVEQCEWLYFLFVDDGSNDSTKQLLATFKEQYPEKVGLHSYQENSGKAFAIQQGVCEAKKWKNFEFYGYFDADLATPLNEIQPMMSYFNNKKIEIVFGSRVSRMGADIQRNEARYYLGRIFAAVVSVFLRLHIYDSQCGAKIFRSSIAPFFEEKFISKWLFDIELIYRIVITKGHEGIKKILMEYPLNTWHEKGNSRLKPTDFLKAPLELLQIHFFYTRKK